MFRDTFEMFWQCFGHVLAMCWLCVGDVCPRNESSQGQKRKEVGEEDE